MPWCGWSGTMNGFWWLMPLVGLLFMTVMVLFCFRASGCAPWGRRRSGEVAVLQREVQSLKDELRKVTGQPT